MICITIMYINIIITLILVDMLQYCYNIVIIVLQYVTNEREGIIMMW